MIRLSFVAFWVLLTLIGSVSASDCSKHDANCTCLTNGSACGNCSGGCKLQDGRCVLKCGPGYAQLNDRICVEYLDTSRFAGGKVTRTFSFGNRTVSLTGMYARNGSGPVSTDGPTNGTDGIALAEKDYVKIKTASSGDCSGSSQQQWMIDVWIKFPDAPGSGTNTRTLIQAKDNTSVTGFIRISAKKNSSPTLKPSTLIFRNWRWKKGVAPPRFNTSALPSRWNRLICIWFVSNSSATLFWSYNDDELRNEAIPLSVPFTLDDIMIGRDGNNAISIEKFAKFRAFSFGEAVDDRPDRFVSLFNRVRGCYNYSSVDLSCLRCNPDWYSLDGSCYTACPNGSTSNNNTTKVCSVVPLMTTPSTITTVVSPTSNRPARVTTRSPPPTSTAGVSSQTTTVTSSVVSAISTSSAGYLTTMIPTPTLNVSTPARLTTTPSSSSAPTSTTSNSFQTTAVTSFVPSASSTASVVHVTTTIPFSWSFTAAPTQKSAEKAEGKSGQSVLYIAAGAGGGALVFIIAVIIIVIVVWLRKRRARKFNYKLPDVIINPTYGLSDSGTEQRYSQQPNGVEEISFYERDDNEYEKPIEKEDPQKVESIYYSTPEESLYWQPATTVTELYAQIEGKKLPKIDRESVVIEKELGSGEFGKVAKGIWSPVTHRNKKIDVAVKTLNSSSHEDHVMFLREAAIMGQFRHKNVVALYGVVTVGEPIMLVLELVENGDLKDRLTDVQLNLKDEPDLNLAGQLLVFSSEIATGMEYLSGKSFIHRDLAARNVLLDHNFTCKIGDFGMARDLADDTYYVTSGGKIPIRWTPPEALYFRKYSTTSDVWSFGIVLYEIWSLGKRPFGPMTNTEVQEMIDAGYRLPPPPGCPRTIYQLMMQCWNPDYHKRPSFPDLAAFLCRDENELLRNRPEEEATMGQIGGNLEDSHALYRDLQASYLK